MLYTQNTTQHYTKQHNTKLQLVCNKFNKTFVVTVLEAVC